MMIRALKMIAEVIAEVGLCSRRMLSLPRSGKATENMAGSIAKYFATSLAMEKVVSAPRVISSCLPISTISMSLVGLESRSTMFPASLAAEVIRRRALVGADPLLHRAGRSLADLAPADQVNAAHPGLRAELDELRALQLALGPLPQPVLVLCEHRDRAAFRRVVRHRRQL